MKWKWNKYNKKNNKKLNKKKLLAIKQKTRKTHLFFCYFICFWMKCNRLATIRFELFSYRDSQRSGITVIVLDSTWKGNCWLFYLCYEEKCANQLRQLYTMIIITIDFIAYCFARNQILTFVIAIACRLAYFMCNTTFSVKLFQMREKKENSFLWVLFPLSMYLFLASRVSKTLLTICWVHFSNKLVFIAKKK